MKKIYTTFVAAALLIMGSGCTALGNMGMGSGTGSESGNGTLGDVLGGVLGGILGGLGSQNTIDGLLGLVIGVSRSKRVNSMALGIMVHRLAPSPARICWQRLVVQLPLSTVRRNCYPSITLWESMHRTRSSSSRRIISSLAKSRAFP